MVAHTWSERTSYQGKAVNWGLRYICEAANAMLAHPDNGGEDGPFTMVQGSWSGASTSAGTHGGPDALDTSEHNWRNRERVFRLLGVAFWHRPAISGVWRAHCHGIVDGGAAAPAGKRQLVAYRDRRNGLRDNGPDRGYRMLVFPMFVFPEKAHGKPGKCWVATGGKTYDQPTPSSTAKRTLKRGQTFDVVAVVNVAGTYWGINAAAECFPMVNLSRTPINAASTPEAPVTYNYPAEILGKRFQKVTLPVDGPDTGNTADELTPPRLLTYTSRYFRMNTAGDSALFTAYHGGATTPNSSNPRCEARETWTDGQLARWDGRRGKHTLSAALAVNEQTPVKPHTVLEQVHNGTDDVATIRAEGVKDAAGKLTDRIKLYGTKGNDSHYAYLGEIKRTQRIVVGFDIADGRIRFVLDGKRHTKTVAATADCFFKLGNYLQSNAESAPGESTRSKSVVRLFAEPTVAHAA
jgi:hypothetical protein